IHSRDPPWVNPALKDLIRRRQRARAENHQPMFRFLRNRVNRERKFCRQRYYDSKVSQLKECKPSAWWKEVKKLSSMSSAVRDLDEQMSSLQHISEESLSASDLANLINDTFVSTMQDFTPDALRQAILETLSRRRQSITTKPFDSITCNSDHKLHELLPPRNNCESNLRRKRNFNVPLAETKRLKNTFIYSNYFIIVTINLIQLLATILIRINYLTLSLEALKAIPKTPTPLLIP
ncbi:unnamed protein product, partial [Porites evermanni]